MRFITASVVRGTTIRWLSAVATSFRTTSSATSVPTDRGWVVVPPTCCPAAHDYGDDGWSVSSVWCTCNSRHLAWRCWCGAVLYAPQPGQHCRLRDRGPVSIWEDEQWRTPIGIDPSSSEGRRLPFMKMIVVCAGSVLALTLAACGGGGGTTSAPSTVTKTVYGSSTTAQAIRQAATPSYKVVVKTTSQRFDHKPDYYVVIAPVDLGNDSFKQRVKLVVQAVAKTNGDPDFSANIYDDEAVANTAYALNTADPFHTATDQESQHLVAMHIGGLDDGRVSTADDAYQIYWYPAASTDTPDAAKYTHMELRWKP
jgi:hypothetical protein